MVTGHYVDAKRLLVTFLCKNRGSILIKIQLLFSYYELSKVARRSNVANYKDGESYRLALLVASPFGYSGISDLLYSLASLRLLPQILSRCHGQCLLA